MSMEINRPVSCPRCGAEVDTQMWPGINAEVNPNLRAQVLRETLFNWTCPECGYVAQLAYPCLYHDKGRRFMVYLVPNGSDEELRLIDVEEEFPQISCVEKRVVPSLAALKEKILIFEAGLNDRAVELTKLALCGVLVKKTGHHPLNGYFSFADELKNRIGFAFFFEGEPHPVQKTTRLDAYHRALEIVAGHGGKEPGFSAVDPSLAQAILEDYRQLE